MALDGNWKLIRTVHYFFGCRLQPICLWFLIGAGLGLALLSCQRCFLLLISMQVLPPFPLSSLAGLYFDLQSSICNYLR